MKIYYARPITHYDTQQDKKTIKIFKEMGFKIEDPNQEKYQGEYIEQGMDVFLDAIEKCNAVFFKSFWDGTISAGVAQEIQHAHDKNITVFEVSQKIDISRNRSVEETREAIKLGMQ